MEEIAQAFHKTTGHQLKISTGASGKFYAQIRNGAPVAVLVQRLGPVELGAHVVGDRLVEAGLGRRQLVGDGGGDAFDDFIAEFGLHPADHAAQFAGVDE